MKEELRFFLRIALYSGLITVIYWLVAYEWAGSLMLGFLFGAALFFVVVVRATLPGSEEKLGERKGIFGLFNRAIGFADDQDGAATGPLQLEDDPFPTATLWPVILASGATLLGLGLIYGPWLWIPGAVVLLSSGAGWFTQLRT